MRLRTVSPRPLGAPGAALAAVVLVAGALVQLVTVHEVDRTRVRLPLSRVGAALPRGAAQVIVARPRLQGSRLVFRFSDGREASQMLGGPTDVYLAALRVVADDPDRPFAIKADATVRYQVVDDVLEQLRKAGVREITLLARPPAEASP